VGHGRTAGLLLFSRVACARERTRVKKVECKASRKADAEAPWHVSSCAFEVRARLRVFVFIPRPYLYEIQTIVVIREIGVDTHTVRTVLSSMRCSLTHFLLPEFPDQPTSGYRTSCSSLSTGLPFTITKLDSNLPFRGI